MEASSIFGEFMMINFVLWDGETPFDADGELVLESECKAIPREQEKPE